MHFFAPIAGPRENPELPGFVGVPFTANHAYTGPHYSHSVLPLVAPETWGTDRCEPSAQQRAA